MKFGKFPFFLKNHSQNVVEKLFPESFLKNQNWTYLWIIGLKFRIVHSDCLPSGGLYNYIKIILNYIKTCRPLAFIS